ncbi:MAG: hypothetical protein QG597_1507 [Actinomycetota bacterium]|nr:hypothetical protein [Actinomycetota bacterium]
MPLERPQCPNCGREDIEDKTARGSRKVVGWVALVVAGYAIIGALVLMGMGIWGAFTGGGAIFGSFFVLAGLICAGLGVKVLRFGMERVRPGPHLMVCRACHLVWSAGAQTPTAEPGSSTLGSPPTGAESNSQSEVHQESVPHHDFGTGPIEGVQGLHDFVRSTLGDQVGDPAALEEKRIMAVRAIGSAGVDARVAGRTDSAESVSALIDLLDVDTGYLAPAASAKKTMRQAVIEELARSMDPATVEPLIKALRAENEGASEAIAAKRSLSWKDKSDVFDRQFAMADARCRVAARALGQLGDPRALAALTEVVEKQSFGTRNAAKHAIDQINQRRSAA